MSWIIDQRDSIVVILFNGPGGCADGQAEMRREVLQCIRGSAGKSAGWDAVVVQRTDDGLDVFPFFRRCVAELLNVDEQYADHFFSDGVRHADGIGVLIIWVIFQFFERRVDIDGFACK